MDDHKVQWLRPEVLLDALFTEQLHELVDLPGDDDPMKTSARAGQERRVDVPDQHPADPGGAPVPTNVPSPENGRTTSVGAPR